MRNSGGNMENGFPFGECPDQGIFTKTSVDPESYQYVGPSD